MFAVGSTPGAQRRAWSSFRLVTQTSARCLGGISHKMSSLNCIRIEQIRSCACGTQTSDDVCATHVICGPTRQREEDVDCSCSMVEQSSRSELTTPFTRCRFVQGRATHIFAPSFISTGSSRQPYVAQTRSVIRRAPLADAAGHRSVSTPELTTPFTRIRFVQGRATQPEGRSCHPRCPVNALHSAPMPTQPVYFAIRSRSAFVSRAPCCLRCCRQRFNDVCRTAAVPLGRKSKSFFVSR